MKDPVEPLATAETGVLHVYAVKRKVLGCWAESARQKSSKSRAKVEQKSSRSRAKVEQKSSRSGRGSRAKVEQKSSRCPGEVEQMSSRSLALARRVALPVLPCAVLRCLLGPWPPASSASSQYPLGVGSARPSVFAVGVCFLWGACLERESV